jgi:hypothetical protein
MTKIFLSLQSDFNNEGSISIAYCFFRNDVPHHGSVVNMMRWCALQMTEKDGKYCDAVLSDIQTRGSLHDTGPVKIIQRLWDRLFLHLFSRDSNRLAILVLDAVDQIPDAEERKKLVTFIQEVAESECKIQIIYSCTDPSDLLAEDNPKFHRTEITKEKVKADMHRVARDIMKHLPRLKKFEREVRTRIVVMIAYKADNELNDDLRRF